MTRDYTSRPTVTTRTCRPSLLDEAEMLVDRWSKWWERGVCKIPLIDMWELNDELYIKAELPGVNPDSVDLWIEGERLFINALKTPDIVPEGSVCYRSERCSGTYSREIMLPFPVEKDGLSATYEHGLLTIRLPKAYEARQKHIEIKS